MNRVASTSIEFAEQVCLHVVWKCVLNRTSRFDVVSKHRSPETRLRTHKEVARYTNPAKLIEAITQCAHKTTFVFQSLCNNRVKNKVSTSTPIPYTISRRLVQMMRSGLCCAIVLAPRGCCTREAKNVCSVFFLARGLAKFGPSYRDPRGEDRIDSGCYGRWHSISSVDATSSYSQHHERYFQWGRIPRHMEVPALLHRAPLGRRM